jgi:hypothetical protein
VAQSYKLRLSDGTVLVVDRAGLSTWLVDGKAMVQYAGSQQWYPLKEFLARERAARRAAQQKAATEPPRDPLERKLPLVPPPPRKEATPPPSRDPLERKLPLVAPPPRKEKTPPPPREEKTLPPARGDDAIAEPPPLFAGEPVNLSIGSPPDVQVLAEEPTKAPVVATPASPSDSPVKVSVRDEEVFVSLPPKPPGEHEDRLRPAPPAREEPEPPSPIGAPPGIQVLADEPAASPAGPTPAPGTEFPAIRLKPSDSAPPARRTAPPWQDPGPVVPEETASPPSPPSPTTPPWQDPEPVPPPAHLRPASPAREEAPVLRFKPADDEPRSPRPSPAPWRDAGPGEEERPRPATRRRMEEPGRAEVALASFLQSPLGGKVWRATDRLGTLLSRGLAPVNRLERGRPLFSPDDDDEDASPASFSAPSAPPTSRSMRSASPDESLPPVPLKPLVGGAALTLDGVRARASAWVGSAASRVGDWVGSLGGQMGDVSTRLRGLVRRERSAAADQGLAAGVEGLTRREPMPPADRPYDPTPASDGLHPSPPLEAPPRVEHLPVLRFKESHEQEETEDVYDGEAYETTYGGSAFEATWVWTKRIVLTAVLVGGAAFVALSWRTWFPKAAQLGQSTFTEIDRQARSRQVARQVQEAVEEASRQLPQLAPESIRLVMAGSPTGVLEAPEVLHAASDAADRGASALAPEEAEELKTLRRRLVNALSPEQRESVLTYERARASRAVFPFEDRAVVPLLAHGVRALPPESQERLQALLGKAVAAGLEQATDAAADGAPDSAPEP